MKKAGDFMEKIKFYEEISPMECMQGDTLPEFYVPVENAENCSMCMILENTTFPGSRVLQRACEKAVEEDTVTFSVQLTSEDTKNLAGMYRMTFWLTDENNLTYVKLTGTLTVVQITQKGESA